MATIDDIALSMQSRIGVRAVVHLVRTFGSAEAVYAASVDELVGRAELQESVAREIVARKTHKAADRELTYCARHGIEPIASTESTFPALMLETDDYPHVLYIKGNTEALGRLTLSMVGTRHISQYGVTMCERLVEGLSRRVPQLAIVSGLAFGVDVNCHRSAVRHGLPTIAVVANALPAVTPAQHTAFAREIVDQGGAIVTELHSQTKQNGRYYIPRNRIIAAMSGGTVVVESGASGGSLHTAAMADSYNRVVMAVPGRVTDMSSEGCNALIRNRKAALITSADDIVAEMGWDLHEEACLPSASEPVIELSRDEAGLLSLIGDSDPISIVRLQELTALDAGTLATLLLNLELAAAIRQVPGKMYLRM